MLQWKEIQFWRFSNTWNRASPRTAIYHLDHITNGVIYAGAWRYLWRWLRHKSFETCWHDTLNINSRRKFFWGCVRILEPTLEAVNQGVFVDKLRYIINDRIVSSLRRSRENKSFGVQWHFTSSSISLEMRDSMRDEKLSFPICSDSSKRTKSIRISGQNSWLLAAVSGFQWVCHPFCGWSERWAGFRW